MGLREYNNHVRDYTNIFLQKMWITPIQYDDFGV